MTHALSRVRAVAARTQSEVPAVFALVALLLSGSGAAQNSAGQEEPMQRLPAGPTTDAPPGNPVYRIAEYADIRTRIKLQILWRKPIDGAYVNVRNRGDSVVLDGQVGSEAERQLAERIALRTTGVARVDNQLQVATALRENGIETRNETKRDTRATPAPGAQAPSDPWISTRVAASLGFDRTVDARRVHIATDDGVVTLSGWVPTAAQKDVAAKIAADIEDVKAVKNVLDVDNSN